VSFALASYCHLCEWHLRGWNHSEMDGGESGAGVVITGRAGSSVDQTTGLPLLCASLLPLLLTDLSTELEGNSNSSTEGYSDGC
jgi:hypothetical protein